MRKPDYTEHSDEHLVRLLAGGDEDALQALAERHSRPAYSLALRVLGDPGWAEEVVQDVLLRLWTRCGQYDPARGDLRRWLLSITHHAAINELRGRRGTARDRNAGSGPLAARSTDGESPFESAWRSLRAERVRAALRELSPQHRQAVALRYYGGLSPAEIAAGTGQPVATIKTRLRRALPKLRGPLERGGLAE